MRRHNHLSLPLPNSCRMSVLRNCLASMPRPWCTKQNCHARCHEQVQYPCAACFPALQGPVAGPTAAAQQAAQAGQGRLWRKKNADARVKREYKSASDVLAEVRHPTHRILLILHAVAALLLACVGVRGGLPCLLGACALWRALVALVWALLSLQAPCCLQAVHVHQPPCPLQSCYIPHVLACPPGAACALVSLTKCLICCGEFQFVVLCCHPRHPPSRWRHSPSWTCAALRRGSSPTWSTSTRRWGGWGCILQLMWVLCCALAALCMCRPSEDMQLQLFAIMAYVTGLYVVEALTSDPTLAWSS